jgi:hypothetical protein
MARIVFYTQDDLEAAINFDEAAFGSGMQGVTPFTISVNRAGQDLGRVVGFEGDGGTIIGMHGLKPDSAAQRGCEITVYRMSQALLDDGTAARVFGSFERWLLKRGWRGNVCKKLKHISEDMVLPVRTFWIKQGFELVPLREPSGDHTGWDEHVVKRWR